MLLDHENRRLAALHDYDALDSPKEEDFDRITMMGARLFGAPLSCITLVDKDRFFFKSTFGTDVRNLDRRPGFCDTTIQSPGVHCIEDARNEPLVQDHPLVLSAPYIKSYAGSPLRTSEGFAIGTLCVMDPNVRVFTDSEKQLLQELAEFVMFHLDRRKMRAAASRDYEERQNVQKLESLGLLSGEIAHDFNNLLVGMLGNASLAARQIAEDSPAQETVADIVRAANQASELTDQLLAYAGQRPTSPKPVDLVQLIGNMAPLLRSSIATDVTFEIDYAADLPAALGDPTQLRQIILNLVTNASDAYCGDEGRVLLRLAKIELSPEDVVPDSGVDIRPGSYVRLEVQDWGCGMSADTLKLMFSPFFSTKVSGRGLGMSIVQRIVRSHGGLIQVESESDKGCMVCLLLPADLVARTDVTEDPPLDGASIVGDGTVLVVDDEELVVSMTASAVKSFGFKVCTALNGAEALERIQCIDNVDALILDATMPGMNGASTLDAVRKHRPDLPTVITSGHHIDEVSSKFQDFDELTFLQKPWTVEQLSSALEEAIRRQSQPANTLLPD